MAKYYRFMTKNCCIGYYGYGREAAAVTGNDCVIVGLV